MVTNLFGLWPLKIQYFLLLTPHYRLWPHCCDNRRLWAVQPKSDCPSLTENIRYFTRKKAKVREKSEKIYLILCVRKYLATPEWPRPRGWDPLLWWKYYFLSFLMPDYLGRQFKYKNNSSPERPVMSWRIIVVCYTLGPIFVVFFILSILITISYSPSYLSNSRNTTTLPKRGPTGKEKQTIRQVFKQTPELIW